MPRQAPVQAATLFVFGTLRDADVRRLVLGEWPALVEPRPVALPGHRAVMLPDETYPVLAPAPGERLPGLLLTLTPGELQRVAFYEGDEYDFDGITVEDESAGLVQALVCAERAGRAGVRSPWSLEQWQQRHKQAFMPLARRHMDLFGHMDATEADGVWKEMTGRR